jgi:hypothetical protein
VTHIDTTALEAAARAVAAAEIAEEGLRPGAEAARGELDLIDQRLAELAEKVDAIRVRRAAGQITTGDSGELLVLAMDRENLTEFRSRAASAVQAAEGAFTAASLTTAAARINLICEERRLTYTTFHTRLHDLLRLAASAQSAATAAMHQLDGQAAIDARQGLVQTAAAAQALLLSAAVEVRTYDEKLRTAGAPVRRPLFNPSDELHAALTYLRMNAVN